MAHTVSSKPATAALTCNNHAEREAIEQALTANKEYTTNEGQHLRGGPRPATYRWVNNQFRRRGVRLHGRWQGHGKPLNNEDFPAMGRQRLHQWPGESAMWNKAPMVRCGC